MSAQANQKRAFIFFRLFDVLMKLCYRLLIPENPNLESDFLSELSMAGSLTTRDALFYFASSRCSHKSLLEVINTKESESEVWFPVPTTIGEKLDQSETRFFILWLFQVLIGLYCRLSGARSLNLRSASTLLIINQLFADCPETAFLRERAKRVLGRALLVYFSRE